MMPAALVAPAFSAQWMTDLEAAKEQAAKEGKAVLIFFTGSDWCPVCAQLKCGVLDLPVFADYAKDKFVLVEIDVPRNPKFSQEQLERNNAVCAQFGVRGLPTIIVISPEGQVLGGFRGGQRDFKSACVTLDAAYENGLRFHEALQLQGMERAKALYAVHTSIPEEFRPLSRLDDEVRELDRLNETGVRDPELLDAEWKEFEAYLATAKGDPAREDAIMAEAEGKLLPGNVARLKALREEKEYQRTLAYIHSLRYQPAEGIIAVDKALACFTQPRQRYELRAYKVEYQIRTAETVEDIMAAKQTMLESIEDFPDNAYQIQLNADIMFRDPEELLEQSRRWRGQ